ncbi:MAG TPA: Lrp/AsnC family transcriptional regulator [Candidatus Nanoarchaeia archaeon]|nr:Lrp/AsnC family transcriptional regulator [Candidatus Nanoarchaeia archaeon]
MRVLTPPERELLLDAKDWRVLKEVITNVRQPLSQVAKRCLLSRQQVEYRLKLLQQNHLLIGSRAVVDIQKLGYKSYHVFIEVHTPEEEELLLKRAQQSSCVNAIIRYSGKYNLEISIMARSSEEFISIYESLVSGVRIRDDHVLVLLRTFISQVLPHQYFPALKPLTDTKFSPIRQQKMVAHTLDATDVHLLFTLSRDALTSNLTLAKKLKISKDTVAYRLSKLEKHRYLREYRPVINYSVLGLSINSMLIKLNYSATISSEFELFLSSQGSILWATRVFGYYDYLIYIITKDLDEFHEVINNIKKKFHGLMKTYEILFAYEQLKYNYMADSIVNDFKK